MPQKCTSGFNVCYIDKFSSEIPSDIVQNETALSKSTIGDIKFFADSFQGSIETFYWASVIGKNIS